MSTDHFKGKDALTHILEKKKEGLSGFSEVHGAEMPGHICAFADAMRESGFLLLLLWLILQLLHIQDFQLFIALAALAAPLIVWKTGRSACLGWSRLERLHRLIEQEKYEIEHHRDQEREELVALYSNKGFEGELLDQIVDVLMADSDRLLKVMLEEEMGLTLEAFEHPLKQATGALIGSTFAAICFLAILFLLPTIGPFLITFGLLAFGGAISAHFEKNRIIDSVVWNVAIAGLSCGLGYFLLKAIV